MKQEEINSEINLVSRQQQLDPLDPQARKSICALFNEIAITSAQITIATLVTELLWNINFVFIGQMSNPKLIAAAGLTDMLLYLSGVMLIIGFNEGFTSLAGRAFGAKHYKLMGEYLNKALTLNTISYAIPVFISLIGDKILIFLFQEPEISKIARDYMLLLLPVILIQYYYDLMRAYLNSMEIYHVHSTVNLFTTLFHPVWCYIFFPLGLKGIAIATTVTHSTNLFALLAYIKIIKPCPESLFLRFSIKNFKNYLGQVVPIALPICFDSCIYIIKTFIVGSFHNKILLAAHILIANILEIFFCFFLGINLALNNLAANAVGEQDIFKCKILVKFAFCSGIVLGSIFVILFLCENKYFFSFFTDSEQVQEQMSKISPIIASFIGPEFIEQILQGILKGNLIQKNKFYLFKLQTGIGLGDSVFWSTLVSYFIIGVPCCLYFGKTLNMKLEGVWIGYGIGSFVLFCLNCWLVYRIEWEPLIKEKHQEMLEEKKQLEEEEEQVYQEYQKNIQK